MDLEEIDEEDDGSPCCQYLLNFLCFFFVILTFPITIWSSIKIVNQYERAVVFQLGRLIKGKPKGPGVYFVLPCLQEYRIVDMRVKSFDVPAQEILTRDSVTVAVDAVVFWSVYNATTMINEVEDASEATLLSAQTTLRNILGTKTLSEILSSKEEMSAEMLSLIDTATNQWGVKVERVEIKDVKLPVALQRTMASEAEATRAAKAKVISAEGETKASIKLKEAADIMSDSPNAIKLRYMQTLHTVAADKNNTIIIPFQEDVVRALLQKFFG